MRYLISRKAMQSYVDAYVKTPREHGAPSDEGLLYKRLQAALFFEIRHVDLVQSEFDAMIRTVEAVNGSVVIDNIEVKHV